MAPECNVRTVELKLCPTWAGILPIPTGQIGIAQPISGGHALRTIRCYLGTKYRSYALTLAEDCTRWC
jgi:hypothetical protein